MKEGIERKVRDGKRKYTTQEGNRKSGGGQIERSQAEIR
jgi:hypothetical protein